jgi:hypothetical protein
MNYTTWFHPDVTIIASIPSFSSLLTNSPPLKPDLNPRETIHHGDLLHVDFGVTALRLNTDTQPLAYVLYPGETSIPPGLKDGLRKVNRLQDIVRSQMKIGITGNEILKASLKQMRSEGIEGKIYCHPIGDWGHSAGTLIGMTNLQTGVPVLGDLPLLGEGYYSVELYAESLVGEIGEVVNFYLEEDVYFDGRRGRGSGLGGGRRSFGLLSLRREGKGRRWTVR